MNNYDPKPVKYPFPNKTDKHYLVVKKNGGEIFDKDYPYVDKSKSFKIKHFFMRILAVFFAMPLMRIRTLLIIRGKKKIKEHKNELKNGFISVCNHVHMWDFIGVMNALKPIKPYVIVWDKNMRGENKKLIRLNNGIPVPTNDFHATKVFSKAIFDLLKDNKAIQIYAEGSMWENYMPIRPFKKGAFYFSVHSGKPVLPMAYSYRKPTGIKKLFWKNPLLTLNVGEPIYPNMKISRPEAIKEITEKVHQAVCRLAGIADGTNVYPPIYDNTERIDYYTTEYGKNYNK